MIKNLVAGALALGLRNDYVEQAIKLGFFLGSLGRLAPLPLVPRFKNLNDLWILSHLRLVRLVCSSSESFLGRARNGRSCAANRA